ncbi:hypothetical protein V5O48_009186 [Marasmius crinis-equi]|uniref:Zn(2)-C6 fungal-type domain-containing protein n=1 Tax=Marasmius crinis-equi TaxID=585013 RepID=A0ABR3FBZ6_9AGAR
MLRHTTDTTGGSSGRRSPACCQVLRRHMTHDGTSGQRPAYYWQLQYYHDALDGSYPPKSSSFAQTVQEEEALFYATFPNARPPFANSEMILAPIPDNGYHQGVGFYPPGSRAIRGTKPELSIQTEGITTAPLAPNHQHVPSRSNSGSTIAPISALVQSPIEQTDNAFTHWVATDRESTSAMTPSTPCSNADDEDQALTLDDHDLTEPDDSSDEDDTRGRSSDRVSPPRRFSTSLDDRSVSATSRGDSGGSLPDLDLTPSEATGTWPSLRVRRNDSVCMSFSGPPADEGQSGHTLTTFGRRATVPPTLSPTSASTSATAAPPCPEPRRETSDTPPTLMRISPLPSHRRPVEKKKAQTLACNFCRGRKIACGPPVPGTVEKTCK